MRNENAKKQILRLKIQNCQRENKNSLLVDNESSAILVISQEPKCDFLASSLFICDAITSDSILSPSL